jgi:hypothetical protein
MTPEEWHASDDVLLLLQAAAGTASDRRLRVYMLACCESVTPPLTVNCFERAVHLLRQQIAGPVYPRAVRRVQEAIRAERAGLTLPSDLDEWIDAAELVVISLNPHTAWLLTASLLQASSNEPLPPIALRQSRKYADLVREVIRPPHATPFADGWRTETVRLLADAIHTDQAFDRLPIHADALEEAGCDNAELLAHCRGPGPHVRGCWALDLVRGCY